MPRRSHTFVLALCASLALHGAIVYLGLHALVTSRIWLAGWDRAEAQEATSAHVASKFFVEVNDTPLGAQDGVGHSIDPAPGETPLEARQGTQDQQFLSRDPAGVGKIGDEPSPSIVPPSEDAAEQDSSGSPPSFGVAPTVPQIPAQLVRKNPAPPEPGQSSEPAPPPSEKPEATAVASADALPPQPPSAQPPAPDSSGATASSNLPAADPAPKADSETDPYSVAGAARFRPGKSDVQFGRKHRLVRPRFDLAAQSAMLKLRSPLVIALKLELDPTGKVTHVDIAKSSGSEDIDQAMKVAAYQWWLEPTKDKSGNPIKDVIPFVIRLD